MIRVLLFSILTIGWFVSKNSYAQSSEWIGFNPVSKNKNHHFVPFELRANLIIVKIQIDHSDTLNFILDSGVAGIIALDTTLKYRINAKPVRKITIRGLGKEQTYNAQVSVGHTVKLPGIVGKYQNLILLEEDFLNLNDLVGIPIHGILGSELFFRFNVNIDYERKILDFSNPDKYRYRKYKGEIFKIYFDKTKPYIIDNEIIVGNKKSSQLKLVIDTGGTHALLLNREYLDPAIIPKKLVTGNLGRGLNGMIEGKLGRIEHFKFANQNFKQVITTFPDSLFYENMQDGYNLVRQGSVGGEILKRFRVNINYKNNFIVFKPIKSKIKKPFESDMSGIDIKTNKSDLHEFEIDRVIPNSAADLAGIQKGDKIVMMNKRLARFMVVTDFYEEFSKKEGNLIQMVVLRGNHLEEISFRLKKII